MSKLEESEDEKSYICFNCLISICHASNEDNSSKKTSKYIMRKENFSNFLVLRQINKLKYNYLNISDSLFYIRDIEECISIFGNNPTDNENTTFSKETHFFKKSRLNENSKFILQHMISGKFVSCIMNIKNNKITLKLVNDVENAYPFSLELINKRRNSKGILRFDQNFYLNSYVQEDNMNYYLGEEFYNERKEKDEINIFDQIEKDSGNSNINVNNKPDYNEIFMNRKPNYELYLINQSDILTNTGKIYTGHLINILFTKKDPRKEDIMMLCLKEKSGYRINNLVDKGNKKVKPNINFKKDKNEEIDKNKYEVSACVYKKELYEQAINNAFWIIEDDRFVCKGSLNIKPICIQENFRIKNALTGFYLDIKQKGQKFKGVNKIISQIFIESENYEYEFCLTDGHSLEEKYFFPNNFRLFHHIINDESTFIVNNGKYILKGVFQNLNKQEVFEQEVENEKIYFIDTDNYYLPISLEFRKNLKNFKGSTMKNSLCLSHKNINNNNILIIKNENDFIFSIKQIDVLNGSQVIYILRLILQLENDLNNKNINFVSINEKIIFLIEYLINIDYSFKDENQEKNVPIRERQRLLWKFDIVNIIGSFLDYCLESFKKQTKLINKLLNFLTSIKRFFNYLSKGEEAIKISIYVLALNKIIALEEVLSNDYSKLIHFIFDLVHHSEILQTYLIGEPSLLKQHIKEDPYLSKMDIDIDNLLSKKKFLELIETNSNFLMFYKNLIILNKVQYKRKEILNDIKGNIDQIAYKIENKIMSEKPNYLQIIEESYETLKKLIIKNVISIGEFLSQTDLNPKFKMRNSILKTKLFSIRGSFSKLQKRNSDSKYIGLSKIGNIKEESQGDSIQNQRSSIINVDLKTDENERKFISSQNTLNPLITQESKETFINEENNLIDKFKPATAKESERQILLTPSTLKSINTKKRKTSRNSLERKKRLNGDVSNFLQTLKIETENLQENENKEINPFEQIKNAKVYYRKILNKLGAIWAFIKWYKGYELKNLIFILDDALKEILNDKMETDKKPLYYFGDYKKNSTIVIKNLRINSSFKIVILYILKFYNHLFKKTQSPLEEKLSDKQNLTSEEILKDMGVKIEKNPFKSSTDIEKDLEENFWEDSHKIDELLGVFYSTYQFYINQYVLIIHKLLTVLSSFLINHETFESIEKIKDGFLKSLNLLLSKVVFLNENTLSFLYSRAKRNPTLISGVFNYKDLIEHSINLLVINSKKKKSKQSLNDFLIKEQMLIDYLYSMCKECDEIKCLYEKIIVLKYIRDLIFDKEIKNNLTEEEFNEQVKKQFKNILELIWKKKRIPILLAYEEYNNKAKRQLTEEHKKKLKEIFPTNNAYEQIDFWENIFYESFKVGDITKFTLKLLKLYEIDEFFGDILYIDKSDAGLFGKEESTVKKIRKLLSKITCIENQVLKIKVSSYLNHGNENNKDINNHEQNINDSSFLIESNNYKYLYHCLGQIQNESLDVFKFNIFDFKSKNILNNMLLMENKTFYKKIEFLNSIKIMIKAINYNSRPVDINILGYVSNLLRIFSKTITIYPEFNSTIKDYFDIYMNLIISSLHCICTFPNNSIEFKVEIIFLDIMYRTLEIFLYIIKNCSMSFEKVKEFMENAFFEIQKILSKFKSIKNKYIYRILYLFGICRVLLYLYNDKKYESYKYKLFYYKIFPISEIDRYFISDFSKEKFRSNTSKMEEIKEEENSESKEESKISKEEKKEDNTNIFFDLNNFPEEMHPVKLDISKNIEIPANDEEMKENLDEIKTENSNSSNEETELIIDESMEWYDEEEKEILSFYSSFLLIYSLYLNEKNLMTKNIDEENKDNEQAISEDLSLDILFRKIKNSLSPKYRSPKNNLLLLNNNNNITTNNNSLTKSEISRITKMNTPNPEINNNTVTFALDFQPINETFELDDDFIIEESSIDPQYLFIFALLQAIINFKNSSNDHGIEIPIKHYIEKKGQFEESEFEENTQNETELLFDKSKNNYNILFYYYDPTYIDIILLEKIMIEIALNSNIKNYCLEISDEYNEVKPALLQDLLKNLNYYKLMQKYQIKEYNLVNNLFVKNNLSLLINKILTTFKHEDLKEIPQMNFFMFKRMGEVYTRDEIKSDEEREQKNYSLIEFLQFNDEIDKDVSNKINILSFLESLIFIIPQYDPKICKILYKMGFQILKNKCHLLNTQNKIEEEEIKSNFNLVHIIKVMIMFFNKKSFQDLVKDKLVLDTMILSVRELLESISEKGTFFLKHFELVKDFLNSLNFILDHLEDEILEIVKYLQRPENLIECDNYYINKIKLERTLEFLLALLNFKTSIDEKILTERVIKFEKEIVEQVIKLIFLILEIGKEKSIEIINLLLDFISEFIKGPDIDNINIIFSKRFLELASFVITNIDYYKLFLNYINKDNIHQMVDNYIRIEVKILKIVIVYYNISFSPKYLVGGFKEIQGWYENNFEQIEKKLKKLFYMSEKEMSGRAYSINCMLLSIKDDDHYTKKEICKRVGKMVADEKNYDKIKQNKDNKKTKNKYCIIKFDLLLVYYTLFNYHKDLSNKDRKFKFSREHKKNIIIKIILAIANFGYGLFKFITGAVSIILPFMYYIFSKLNPQTKKDVDFLQELQEIEIKCESINEERIINTLKNYIRKIEVSINNILFKVYFPMIDKANTLLEYRKEYLKVDEIDASDFTNYLLSKYDYIHIRAKQNALINRWLWEIPILNYIFKNMEVLGVLLILLGLASTFLIISSFNTFTTDEKGGCGRDFIYFVYARSDIRLQCPKFLYSEKFDTDRTVFGFYMTIMIQCILQGVTFIDYIMRTIFVESEMVSFDYNIEKIKDEGMKANLKLSKCDYVLHIIIPTFFRCIFNFKTFYYILSLFFLILSITVHPFFNCIILLEFVNRIEIMQNIVKAMYRPMKNILIILLMFIILEYFFSFFAQSYFTFHFPNITDTSNFLKTFMRMIDQTFKQDGGIGTYLDKSLEPNYEAHSMTGQKASRLIFDGIFYFVVVLLVFQMFLSVIIDYFNETRENSGNFNEAMDTECLVCGINREKIEKINPNDKNAFEKHIANCHNVFNYLYYLMYLQSIDDKDVIIDNGVWDLHLVKNLSYLPKNEFFKELEIKRWEKYNNSIHKGDNK